MTEILPTRHFIPSKDGKSLIEIPEQELSKLSIDGSIYQNWHIAEGAPGDHCHDIHSSQEEMSETSSETHIVDLHKGESSFNHPWNMEQTGEPTKTPFEPFLVSRTESMAPEGFPRTESVWRHPPRWETADGRTQPAYLPIAFSGEPRFQSSGRSISSEDAGIDHDLESSRLRNSALSNRGLSYKDLPLIPGQATSPTTTESPKVIARKPIKPYGDIKDRDQWKSGYSDYKTPSNGETGQATKGLRRIRDKIRSASNSMKGRTSEEH